MKTLKNTSKGFKSQIEFWGRLVHLNKFEAHIENTYLFLNVCIYIQIVFAYLHKLQCANLLFFVGQTNTK